VVNWLLRWVISGIALAIVANLGIGVTITEKGMSLLMTYALATVVIGLVNSIVRPVLRLLTLPLNCLTFGLFGWVLNALLFYATHYVVPGFEVKSVLGALLGPALMSFITSILSFFLPDKKED
jgi:putative membrane protein